MGKLFFNKMNISELESVNQKFIVRNGLFPNDVFFSIRTFFILNTNNPFSCSLKKTRIILIIRVFYYLRKFINRNCQWR